MALENTPVLIVLDVCVYALVCLFVENTTYTSKFQTQEVL